MENNSTKRMNPITGQPFTKEELSAFTGAYGDNAFKKKPVKIVANIDPAKKRVQKITASEKLLAEYESGKAQKKKKKTWGNGLGGMLKAAF